MMRMIAGVLLGLAAWPATAEGPRVLLIIIDGLRPDYLSAERTPHLHALGARGVVAERHTVAFPSYTRPNSATITTGCHPGTHGLLHNTMYDPAVGGEPFNTADAEALRAYHEATGGNLLTAPHLGELLAAAGKQYFVTGTASAGATHLHNPSGAGKGTWHAGGEFLPPSAREEALAAVGPLPADPGTPEGTDWAVAAYLHHALGEAPPDVTLLWIGATDSAGHRYGVGAPETLAAVSHTDAAIGRILEAHAAHGLEHKVAVFVSSDHGFSSTTGGLNVPRILSEAGVELDGIRVVSNMVWVEGDDPARLARIGEALQRHEAVGAIYSRPVAPGSTEGAVPGTLSTEVIRWNHPRSADLIVSPAWTDAVNEHGYAGTTAFNGTATHGSDSPFDMQIHLLAAGPGVRSGLRSTVPTGNADLAPTILHLLGVAVPAGMDGRVLEELLEGGPEPGAIEVESQEAAAEIVFQDGLRYQTSMEVLAVGEAIYLRGARTQRGR